VHWPTTLVLLYERLEAATDESVAALYRFLDGRYPNSKFVLTVRDEHDWLRSVRNHRARHGQTLAGLARSRGGPGGARLDRSVEICFSQMALYGSVEPTPASFLAGYERHKADVLAYFEHRPEDLLVLDLCNGQGWRELCAFLSLEIPANAFPYENRGA